MSKKGECFKQINKLRSEIAVLKKIVRTQTKELKEQKEYTKTQIEPRL